MSALEARGPTSIVWRGLILMEALHKAFTASSMRSFFRELPRNVRSRGCVSRAGEISSERSCIVTRMQTLLVTTVLAAAVPLATAMAQSSRSSCGPETWSAAKMGYTKTPCNAGDATAAVGTSGPTAYGSGNSSSMTKAQMKQPDGYAPPGYAPMRSQAVAAEPSNASMMGNHMMATQSCGPARAVTITDEYGRKYNCRGDRIR